MDEPTPLPRPPGLSIARAIALCAIFYVVYTAAGFVVNLPFYSYGPPSEWPSVAYWLTPIPFLVAWLGTIKLGLQWARLSFREACPLTRFPLRIVPTLFAIALGATILFVEFDTLIPMPEFFRESFGAFGQVPLLVALLLAVVIAPVAEELFFRGLLFRRVLGTLFFHYGIGGGDHPVCRVSFKSVARDAGPIPRPVCRLARLPHRLAAARNHRPRVLQRFGIPVGAADLQSLGPLARVRQFRTFALFAPCDGRHGADDRRLHPLAATQNRVASRRRVVIP